MESMQKGKASDVDTNGHLLILFRNKLNSLLLFSTIFATMPLNVACLDSLD